VTAVTQQAMAGSLNKILAVTLTCSRGIGTYPLENQRNL
jgi:hypothetical protein